MHIVYVGGVSNHFIQIININGALPPHNCEKNDVKSHIFGLN